MREPTRGEMELEERSSLRHVVGLSTELQDITDAEYRELRLEKVVLVGVWTEGSVAQAEAAMAELAALAETAGAAVLDVLIQREVVGAVDNLHDNVSISYFFQRGAESFDELGGKVANESDSVSQDN